MAVVGAGRLGRFHAQKIAAHAEAELVAVVDPDAKNGQRVAAECGALAVADCEALPGAIDAAVVAAPTRLHHRLSLELLRRNAHLLVEKPICASRQEADELVEAARASRRVLQVGHVERFNPAFESAQTVAAKPKYIEAVRASGFTFRSTDVGVVLDLMIHDVDLVLSMVRSPLQRVEALGTAVLGGHEDLANARLHFECGCVATLSASRVSYEPARRMQVYSADGFAAVDFATRTATLVRPSETLRRGQFDVDALTAAETEHYKEHLFEEHLPREQTEHAAVDALAAELDDFVQSILAPRQPRVSGEAGRDALAVAEQILDAIAAHASGAAESPVAVPHPSIPAPHFNLPAVRAARKQAG